MILLNHVVHIFTGAYGNRFASLTELVLCITLQSGIVAGQKCGIEFKDGRIQIMADPLPEYRFEELLANSEFPEVDELGIEELNYINATVVGG